MGALITNDSELICMVDRAYRHWVIENRYKSYRQFRKWLFQEYGIDHIWHNLDFYIEFYCDQGRMLFVLTWG